MKSKTYLSKLRRAFKTFKTTEDIPLPNDPLSEVIGQDKAVRIARIAAKQRRHLLLVGPPGTGKSLIAKGISSLLPKPMEQIVVIENPDRPERPIAKVERRDSLKEREDNGVKIVEPYEVPDEVAEQLGYKCSHCGRYSDPDLDVCPFCGSKKREIKTGNPFMDLLPISKPKMKIMKFYEKDEMGRVNINVYEAYGPKIKVYPDEVYRKIKGGRFPKRNVIVPFDRNTFILVSGSSESELLGDVQHDPYGGHPEIGIPPHMRVVPGAVHEAHEGVLYIDEMSTLSMDLQKSILTAMQEKKFPIAGRNATSTGAVVKVENVPCDFVLVGAVNINELGSIMPALRSRITGSGYEVLMNVAMENTKENRAKYAQFVAQEIKRDGKLPPADREAVMEIITIGKEMAKKIDGVSNGLTLRLRRLAGIIKMAGDISKTNGDEIITRKHIREAFKYAKPIEEQLREMFSNWMAISNADTIVPKPKTNDVR